MKNERDCGSNYLHFLLRFYYDWCPHLAKFCKVLQFWYNNEQNYEEKLSKQNGANRDKSKQKGDIKNMTRVLFICHGTK